MIETLLQEAVAAKSAFEPKPKLEILASGQKVLADWASLDRVIGHLIQNAIEATPKNGIVKISLKVKKTIRLSK